MQRCETKMESEVKIVSNKARQQTKSMKTNA
jgi:hypothetical protein